MLGCLKKNSILVCFLVILVLFLFYNRYYILELTRGSMCIEGMRNNLRFGRVKSHRSKVQEGATEYIPGPDYTKMTGGSTEYIDESSKYFNQL